MDADVTDLASIAKSLRRRVVQMHHAGRCGHLGSSLSCADILTALYWGGVLKIDPDKPTDPDRDRFILSKGHAASALYAALAYKGHFAQEELYSFAKDGSRLTEHPPVGLSGVEFAGGSLGHGLPVAVGIALAGRLTNKDYRVFCLLGDGDCQEGSTWEAAAFAGQNLLRRLCVIVDVNNLQGIRRSPDGPFSLSAKFEAFGWNAGIIDGHDPDLLVRQMQTAGSHVQPLAIIAETTKGKGVSYLENAIVSHYKIPNDEEFAVALAELE